MGRLFKKACDDGVFFDGAELFYQDKNYNNHGLYERFYKNNLMSVELYYNKGVIIGLGKWYHENGYRQTIFTNKNGRTGIDINFKYEK